MIIFPCGDLLNTTSYKVPWISRIGVLSLTLAMYTSSWRLLEGKEGISKGKPVSSR
jgi:hypothetical protein